MDREGEENPVANDLWRQSAAQREHTEKIRPYAQHRFPCCRDIEAVIGIRMPLNTR